MRLRPTSAIDDWKKTRVIHCQAIQPILGYTFNKESQVRIVRFDRFREPCGMPADYAVERNISVISLKATRVGARSSRTQDKEEGEPVK
jgi:hypothetical protein